MIEDGLFDRFPVTSYGMQFASGKPGTFEICRGAAMAGAAFFDVHVTGKARGKPCAGKIQGCHSITNSLITDLNAIVSRNVPPLIPASLNHTGACRIRL